MKKFIIGSLFALATLTYQQANSQVRLSLGVNLGSQPNWGPSGYDHVDYYYLPDIESYYYVPTKQFVYLSGNRWVFSSSLPSRYRNYDLYSGYKVVVNQPNAYRYYNTHRTQYSQYRGNHSQVVIRGNNNNRNDRNDRNRYNNNNRRNNRDRRHY
jgi:hypothetical protein